MTAVIIRRAREDDIPELTDLAVDAWQYAYGGVLAPESLKAGPINLTKEIREGWEQMFVAEANRRIAGFFSFVPGSSHIRHIYVHRNLHRQGIGSLMMAAALDILRERGFHEATIDVVEDTDGARFNRALGWREIRREELRDGTVVISMRKVL